MDNSMRNFTETASELTKNALSFSWSLSLFGAQQMANLLSPSRASAAFDHAARAMQLELNDVLQSAYRTGDSLQHRLVDWTMGSFGQAAAQTASVVTAPDTGRSRPRPPGARSTGWGPMPFPVIPPSSTTGPAPSPAEEISPNYPFEPHYIEVLGSRMHYVDIGSGDPILLLHGNPTWSYLWRNIIPHLAPLGRCIAPDLIGYGRSDKPDIEYHWRDHVRYLEGFIEKLGLRNITLVLHDQGSGLGFHYAMRHEDNIKGIAFFEAIIRPYSWEQFSTPEYRELFRTFRSGGRNGPGWRMIVDENMFIEKLLPQAAGRALSQAEMEYYREPFKDRKSRIPIWRFPQETPIGGEPRDVWNAVSTYSERLQQSRFPKLLLYAKPGALVTAEHLEWARKNFPKLETVHVGDGSHFLQESSPHTIGRAIARWICNLPGNEHLRDQPAADSGRSAAAAPFSASPTRTASRAGASPQVVQGLIDQAAYFNLFSSPDASRHDAVIRGAAGEIIGFRVKEILQPFAAITQQADSERSLGRFNHRWMIIPDDFVALPGREPPPTPVRPNVSQRFVMLDAICNFGSGRDGFRGFGTGHTVPTVVNGRNQLLVVAVGTILDGFGSFAGHRDGTYVYCGELDSRGGFTGNVMLRVMDTQRTLHTSTSRSADGWQQSFDGRNTYVVFRGEAVPSDPVRPNLGPDGRPIGLVVEQGLKLQQISNSMTSEGSVNAASHTGQRRVGRVTAHVAFDPQSASGTNENPIPFTAYDEFEFQGTSGAVAGSFIADTDDGRVFNTSVGGQQAIRFGGVGRIHRGTGVFQGIQGLMTDNSVVVFDPHVSASVYVLRVWDPEARFRSVLNRI